MEKRERVPFKHKAWVNVCLFVFLDKKHYIDEWNELGKKIKEIGWVFLEQICVTKGLILGSRVLD